MLKKIFVIFLFIFIFGTANNRAFAQEVADPVGNIANIEDNPEDFSFDNKPVSTQVYDPLEGVNRKIFAFNEVFDRYFFEHVALAYRDYVPKPARNVIGNFLRNLSMPLVVVNSALQGDLNNSMASFSTFLINTTIGVGGLFDIAKAKEIKYSRKDLGQTFGKYKIGQGPYLVLPFLGPSDTRDFAGMAIEKLVDPFSFNSLEIGGSRELLESDLAISFAVASAVDTRERLLDVVSDVRKNSFDGYATIRSAYLQQRNSLINNN